MRIAESDLRSFIAQHRGVVSAASTQVSKSHVLSANFFEFGKTPFKKSSHLFDASLPENHLGSVRVHAGQSGTITVTNMSKNMSPITTTKPTLQDVIEALKSNPTLSETRQRDLRSAVNCYAALTDSVPALIPLDLAAIARPST